MLFTLLGALLLQGLVAHSKVILRRQGVHDMQSADTTTSSPVYTTTITGEPFVRAVDLGGATDSVTFSCLKSNAVSTVLVQVYDPSAHAADLHAVNTILLASRAGFASEALHVPDPSYDANTQIDQSISALRASGITVRMMWLQVQASAGWSGGITANRQFILAALQRIWRYGVLAGIMTSAADWSAITAGLSEGLPNTPLWYIGASGSAANFADFMPFGPWLQPYAKKYLSNSGLCEIYNVGEDVICRAGSCVSAQPTSAYPSTFNPYGSSPTSAHPTTGYYNPTTYNPYGSSTASVGYTTGYTNYPTSGAPGSTGFNNQSSLLPSSQYPYTGPTTPIPHIRPCPDVNTTCAVLYRDDCQSVVVWSYEWLYDLDEEVSGFDGNIRLAFVQAKCTLNLFSAVGWKGKEDTLKASSTDEWVELTNFTTTASAKCQCAS